jgi:hypothetical protein
MKKFFYYLMIENLTSEYSLDKWIRVWHDVVEATDKKTAKKIIEEDNSAAIAEKISAKTKTTPDYRVFITELTPYWEIHWLKVRECKSCNSPYTLLEAKQTGSYANIEHCSAECKRLERRETDFGDYSSGYSDHRPCIYKIFNKQTGKTYIGQTTQCFTLRWYQHFFQSTETKFHQAVSGSQPSDWIFEVLEVIYEEDFKTKLNQREQYFIDLHNSINDGYNSVKAGKSKAPVETSAHVV